jgi:hypothetical protein
MKKEPTIKFTIRATEKTIIKFKVNATKLGLRFGEYLKKLVS